MTLHILITSPNKNANLQDCLQVVDKTTDALVLLADGVYCLNSPLLTNTDISIFYLQEDANSMGIISTGTAQPISYMEFVALTEIHQSINTWH